MKWLVLFLIVLILITENIFFNIIRKQKLKQGVDPQKNQLGINLFQVLANVIFLILLISYCLFLYRTGESYSQKQKINRIEEFFMESDHGREDSIKNKDKIEVYTDVEFIESQFPNMEEIQSVKYIYIVSNTRDMIGPSNIKFCGFIKIGENFLQKIEKEYKWEELEKDEKIVPKSILTEGQDKDYHFTYNYEFCYDGKYISSASWGGEVYLDREQSILYFELDRL